LLADDKLGATRDGIRTEADLAVYQQAFDAIDRDAAQLLVVGAAGGRLVATLQLMFLPGLSHRGALRAQIESVRVAAAWPSARCRARFARPGNPGWRRTRTTDGSPV
jgi:hypothetical protein